MAKESVIRLMTRLADKFNAINLAQGFTDEAPPYEMVWAAVAASLGGTKEGIHSLQNTTLKDIHQALGGDTRAFLDMKLKDVLRVLQNPKDTYNQYSYPFGLLELRQSVADYIMRFQGFRPDPETEVTISAGVTAGMFSTLGALCRPGDEIIICQPFHEMFPSQAEALGLKSKYITLRKNYKTNAWDLDENELRKVVSRKTKLLILNSPHNPTGKVFTADELLAVAKICKEHDLMILTDEIYEHFIYDNRRHQSVATIPDMRENTIVVSGISKTGGATGWRVGWVISPSKYTPGIRAFHDTSVIQAPTPLQKAAENLLRLDDKFFDGIRKRYIEKRNILTKALQDAGFIVDPPEGSYYVFASFERIPSLCNLAATDAAMYLIEKIGVASVPGDNFYAVGDYGNKYLRFAFCRSNKTLNEAASKLTKLA
ncbi:MAG: pyridoxal phosphate-dependent aminotransferase [Dehalococcoidia bacterium]